MRMRNAFIAVLLAAGLLPALAVDRPLTVQYGTEPEALGVRQANEVDFIVTLLSKAGAAVSLAGRAPYFWWAESETATGVSTAACSVVDAPAGIFRAHFTSAALNRAGVGMAYGVGVYSNGYDTAWIGPITIYPDALATGAGAVVWTTNVNLSLWAFSGTATGGTYIGTFVGDGAGLTNIIANATNDVDPTARAAIVATSNALAAAVLAITPASSNVSWTYGTLLDGRKGVYIEAQPPDGNKRWLVY